MASGKTTLEKPRITRISLTEDQLKLLNRMSRSTTDYSREYIRKHTGTGVCVMCEKFATYIATYEPMTEFVPLFKSLDDLKNRIGITDELDDETKLDYQAEVKTIQSQLSKPNPGRNILSKSWDRLKGLVPIASLAIAIHNIHHTTNPTNNRRLKFCTNCVLIACLLAA
jgi:hypothetical protein